MVISSTENDKVKEYFKLRERKHRKNSGIFLVEGLHLVLEAYRYHMIEELILVEGEELPLEVPTVFVSEAVMAKISTLESAPRAIALCKMRTSNRDFGDKVLMLDGVQDPGNLGAIIRSSLAFGVSSILLSPETVDIYNPKVIRATQGMIFGINILVCDLEDEIKKFKQDAYSILGTDVELGIAVEDLPKEMRSKYVLILGNEGRGVSKNLLNLCDNNLTINMNNQVESLNVAVAGSILVYELGKEAK